MNAKDQPIELDLSHKEFMSLNKDYESAAAAVDLMYVNDAMPGISRKGSGKGFTYSYKGKAVSDDATLGRIRKLAIPPAWEKVWICAKPNGHIQATGFDVRGRKQYRYHTKWNKVRSDTKFHRLFEFGKAIPLLRVQLDTDISGAALTERKVLAAVILLMERTYIRVGNYGYEKMNGSYGLTTLKDKHVQIKKGEMKFAFKGKKGVFHNISLKNRKLAKVVKECRDIPGKELFQYYDPDGNRKSIDSGSVNQYIKDATGMDFSAKDFRLWAGSLNVLRSLKEMECWKTSAECKQNVLKALDQVSMKLGNTRTVCKNYYVHPGIIRLYEEDGLSAYLKQLGEDETDSTDPELHQEEKVLMKILSKLK